MTARILIGLCSPLLITLGSETIPILEIQAVTDSETVAVLTEHGVEYKVRVPGDTVIVMNTRVLFGRDLHVDSCAVHEGRCAILS